MQIQIPAFGDMPKPLKIGSLLLMGSGGIVAIVWLVWPQIAPIILIGFLLLGFLFALYAVFLGYLKKRRSAPMEKGLGGQSLPSGINSPKSIADLDDLKKKFEAGIANFKAAGKSLYDFPWYLVVGEPGSGKTEAIRHSNIGFPAGLQDPLQGTGGTINMNWWFTDHAVVLDTAGRLMFEEIEAGGCIEWLELLKLLKKFRTNCPINGMLLVIPADSLIKDTVDEIERKASKIAKQFDVIQRSLDVRFPVFVIISKADLIQGFRDFFDKVKDPRLQHQILGWSNPAPLDEPFNTGFIDQHITAIRKRLLRRRLGLMQQLANETDTELDNRQADVLYAFPHNLSKLAPRMSRYLELIFSVGSKWSCKPVFFRGIYFTSSMQEGSALDMELAELLGRPVEDLPDGRVWARERAFFLRDLFIKKMFPEQGLVTRATNAKKVYTRRRAAVYGTAIASILMMLFFTIYCHLQWKNTIGSLGNYFRYATDNPNKLSILDGEKYAGNRPVKDNNINLKIVLYEYYADLGVKVKDVKTPWIYKPAAKMAGSLSQSDMQNAAAKLYETNVLLPVINAGVSRITDSSAMVTMSDWTMPPGTNGPIDAAYNLLALNTGRPLSDDISGYSSSSFLDAFFELAFEAETLQQMYIDHREDLHHPLKTLYAATGDTRKNGSPAWPSGSLKLATAAKVFLLAKSFVAARESGGSSETEVYNITNLLLTYDKQEQVLLNIKNDRPEFLKDWQEQFNNLQMVYEKIKGSGLNLALLADYDPEKDIETLTKAFDYLLDPLKVVQEDDPLWQTRELLLKNRERLIHDVQQSDANIKAMTKKFCEVLEGRTLLEIRHSMYTMVSSYIKLPTDNPIHLVQLSETAASLDNTNLVVVLAHSKNYFPTNDQVLKELIRRVSEGKPVPFKQLAITSEFDLAFHPAAADRVFEQWLILDKQAEFSWDQKDRVKDVFIAYAAEFWGYWFGKYPETYIREVMLTDVKGHLHKPFSMVLQELEILRDEIAAIPESIVHINKAKHAEEARLAAESVQMNKLGPFFDRWKRLENHALREANSALLNDADLKANYFPYHPANKPGEIDKLYGRLLADKALQSLANRMRSDIDETFNQIVGFTRQFPLNKSGSQDLAIEDYNKMRAFLDGLNPSQTVKRTGIDQIDMNLEVIDGGELSLQQRELYDRLKPTLDKLPAFDKPFTCKIFLAEADDPVNREKLNRHFFTVRGQCGTWVKERRLNEPEELLTVSYPDNEAVYLTCISESGPFEIKISGPWAPLRMAVEGIDRDSVKGILWEPITHYLDPNTENSFLPLKIRLEFFDAEGRNVTEKTRTFLKS